MKNGMNNCKSLSFMFLFFAVLIIQSVPASSEIIRLKDGQVIRGEIVKQGDAYLRVKTRYQTRLVRRSNIERIEKGGMELRKIYIFTREGVVIEGYLVEEDSQQVIYRKSKTSSITKNISKLDILRMSQEPIRPVDLEFAFKPGIFYPFNTGGAELAPSSSLMANLSLNSMIVSGLRVELDAGYTKSENSDEPERFMQIVPVTLSLTRPFKFGNSFFVSPRLGAGLSMVDYDSGQGEEMDGQIFTVTSGLKFQYSLIARRFYIGLFFDYYMLWDSSGKLHAGIAGVSLSYRL